MYLCSICGRLGDKKTADNSSYDKAEKTTTAAVTEEAQTTEEITTEAVTEAAKEAAVPEGLSDKYADLDNRSFIYNGHLFTLGKTTMQELLDAGYSFKGYDEEDYNSTLSANGGSKPEAETEHAEILLDGAQSISCEFINPTLDTTIPLKECVICQADFVLYQNSGNAALDNSSSGRLELAYPYGITREELYANSGEPTEIDDELNRVDYLVESDVYYYMGSRIMDTSGYKFFFQDNKLCEVHMSWLP